jgi:hypothetical protein
MILLDDSGSIAPMDAKRVLQLLVQCYRTLRADIAQGACAKSSTML